MPDWLMIAFAGVVTAVFAGAVAFGRPRQPCAVRNRIGAAAR